MMSGCLHHVVNEHTWALDECKHADMSEEETAKKPWMTKGSAAHPGPDKGGPRPAVAEEGWSLLSEFQVQYIYHVIK